MPTMSMNAEMRATPAADGEFVTDAWKDYKVEILETQGEWHKIRLPDIFGKPVGWVPAVAVSDGEPAPGPIDKEHFARECWRQAVFFGVNPHYLAAVGELRSRIANDRSGNEIGLFRLLQVEWDADWNTQEFGFQLAPTDIGDWRQQCAMFALMAHRAMDQMEKATGGRPSATTLYLAQIVGAKAAIAMEQDGSRPLDAILAATAAADLPPGGQSVASLIDRHARFLKSGAAVATGQQAMDGIAAALQGALDSMRPLVLAGGASVMDDPSSTVVPAGSDGSRLNLDSAAVPAGRKDMARKIADAFAASGFGFLQQVAAIANAIAESGLRADASNVSAIEASYGLFQINTNKKALGFGKDPAKLKTADYNIAVIMEEAKKYADFANADSLAKAVDVFVRKVERPANQDAESAKRLAIARQLVA